MFPHYIIFIMISLKIAENFSLKLLSSKVSCFQNCYKEHWLASYGSAK